MIFNIFFILVGFLIALLFTNEIILMRHKKEMKKLEEIFDKANKENKNHD